MFKYVIIMIVIKYAIFKFFKFINLNAYFLLKCIICKMHHKYLKKTNIKQLCS